MPVMIALASGGIGSYVTVNVSETKIDLLKENQQKLEREVEKLSDVGDQREEWGVWKQKVTELEKRVSVQWKIINRMRYGGRNDPERFGDN